MGACLPSKHHAGPSTRSSLPEMDTKVKCCLQAPQQKRECASPFGLNEPPMSSRKCTGCGTWQREPAAHGTWQRAQESSPRTVLAASLPMMCASTSSAVAALSGGSVSRLWCFTCRENGARWVGGDEKLGQDAQHGQFAALCPLQSRLFTPTPPYTLMALPRLGPVFFGNGNRGSFPGTVTGPPLVTADQAHREYFLPGTVTGNRLRYGNGNRTSAGYPDTPNLKWQPLGPPGGTLGPPEGNEAPEKDPGPSWHPLPQMPTPPTPPPPLGSRYERADFCYERSP